MADHDPIPWLSQLPNEILMKIMLEASPKDLQALCRTSKAHAQICRNDYFWKRRFQQDFPNLYNPDFKGSFKILWEIILTKREIIDQIKDYFKETHESFEVTQPDDNTIVVNNHLAEFGNTWDRSGKTLNLHQRVLSYSFDSKIYNTLKTFADHLNRETLHKVSILDPGNIIMFEDIIIEDSTIKIRCKC